MTAGRNRRICILALKRLDRNTRVLRQAETLINAGFEVTICSATPDDLFRQAWDLPVRHVAVIPRPPIIHHVGLALDEISPGAGSAAARPRRGWLAAALYPLSLLIGLGGYALIRLQQPAAQPMPVAFRDVWRGRLNRVLGALVRPYIAELNRRDFEAKAWRLLSGESFDLIQAHDSYTVGLGYRLARRSGARFICDLVELFEDLSDSLTMARPALVSRWLASRTVRFIRRADTTLTVSDGIADWMMESYRIERPVVIRNCQKASACVADGRLRRDAGLAPDARILLYLNTVYPGQGLKTLIRAVPAMPRDIHLVILGREKTKGYLDECRRLARDVGAASRVIFLAPCPIGEVVAYASGADAGIIPRLNTSLNNYYSLPNRIFELVSARLPMAVADLPCMRALVEEHDLGEVFDPREPADILAAVERLFAPDRLAAVRRNVEDAAGELTWEREGARYLEAIASASADQAL